MGILVTACTPEPRSGRGTADASTTYEKHLTAAWGGDPKSQNLIGYMHFFGEGAPVNQELAHRFFHLAAKSGFTPALRNLAVMHWLGTGTHKDLGEARRYAREGGIADLEILVQTMPLAVRDSNWPTGRSPGAADQAAGLAEKAYATFCAGCHGLNGIAAYVGSPSFALGERMEKPDEVLLNSIRNGRGVMPGWGTVLSEARLRGVLEFVREFQANYEQGIAQGVRRVPDRYFLFGPMIDDDRAYQGEHGG